jgi:UDP-N-acetylglucosamine--N-acetylmuramyl-(pentapeptide) pyrophosphoryl-undecaprenol N-acetylglucosamine transferase
VDGAVVIDQSEASPAKLREMIFGLISDPDRRARIGGNAAAAGRPDAAARLADQLLELAQRRKQT